MASTRHAVLCAALGALVVAAPARAQRGKANSSELASQVEEVSNQLKSARDNLVLVEKQYTNRSEPTDDLIREERFTSGEIQYLLGDYKTASTLFYDLVEDKDFEPNPRYVDALFYLSDSLYAQKNFLSARVYLKKILNLRRGRYKESLARYLEIAGRLNEFSGIDEYINQARGLSGGQLSPELTYVYGKWLFRREDLPLAERMARARGAFTSLAEVPGGAFRLQAQFFLGVSHVKLKEWEQAIARFRAIAKEPERDEKDRQVKELASLSLGRVLFEVGKYDEAIDRYQEISQQSENFPDSLYETAWSYVKKGDYERAKNAVDVLLLVAEDSPLGPEAKILQGTLLLKLQRYEDATASFDDVINAYLPVRDEIHALLAKYEDPVRYFDDLIAREDKTLDVTSMLPPIAAKWATTRRDVADAVDIINAIEDGRRGVAESQGIAARILKTIEERGLEAFPLLQEGYRGADAVDTSITRAQESLTRIEGYLVGSYLSPEQQAELAQARAESEALKARIQTLPTTPEEVEGRKARIQARVDELDREAFRLGIDAQSLFAQLAAVQKYVDDTRKQRKDAPEDEKAFLEKVNFERKALEALVSQLEALRSQLVEERNNSASTLAGEGALKQDYEASLQRQREVFQRVRGSLPNDANQVLLRADVVRADAQALRDRVGIAKQIVRDRVTKKAERLKQIVAAEQTLLQGYGGDVQATSGNARDLVGRITFDSFKRVEKSFEDLVLKANVGVVDVAFTRKQDKTTQIQKLSQQKDRELKSLDDEFKEVLKDVD